MLLPQSTASPLKQLDGEQLLWRSKSFQRSAFERHQFRHYARQSANQIESPADRQVPKNEQNFPRSQLRIQWKASQLLLSGQLDTLILFDSITI